jgi:hypothetical protein
MNKQSVFEDINKPRTLTTKEKWLVGALVFSQVLLCIGLVLSIVIWTEDMNALRGNGSLEFWTTSLFVRKGILFFGFLAAIIYSWFCRGVNGWTAGVLFYYMVLACIPFAVLDDPGKLFVDLPAYIASAMVCILVVVLHNTAAARTFFRIAPERSLRRQHGAAIAMGLVLAAYVVFLKVAP